jgi:elongation factor P
MVIASELRDGVVVRIEGQIYKVLELESKAGAAKMGGVVKAKMVNVRSGRAWEPHFRPLEKLEDLQIDRRQMEFLYADGDGCTFMRPDTFEQVTVPSAVIGPAAKFLQAGEQVPVEFFGDEAISVVLPPIMEARISRTAPPIRSQQDSTWKEALLENGLTTRVPLFIAEGETVRIEVNTGRYIERAHADRRRTA